MSEPKNSEDKSYNMFEAWQGLRNAGLETWAKAMTEAVNSEEYAKTSGAMLDAYLTASIPLRETLEKAMAQALQQMNMPTRADFISLAERLIQVEMRLDDMDAKLDDMRKQSPEPSPTPKKRSATAAPPKAKARKAKKR